MYDIKELYEAFSVEEAVRLRLEHPGADILAGGSDVLVQIREGRRAGREMISIYLIDTLRGVALEEDGTLRINEYITLENYGGEYHVYMYDYEYLETYVNLTQEIPDSLTFEDGIEPKTGDPLDEPVKHTAQEFRDMLTEGGFPDFATDNVNAYFDENGKEIDEKTFTSKRY